MARVERSKKRGEDSRMIGGKETGARDGVPAQGLRILIVSLDSCVGGGMTAVTQGLAKELLRLGADLRLLESGLGLPRDSEPRVVADGPVYRVALPGAMIHDYTDVLRDCGDPVAEAAFRLVLKDWRPDVVFFAHVAGLGMSLIQVARQEGLPTLVYVGDYYFMCPILKLFHRSFGRCADPMQGLGCSRCTTGRQDMAPLYNFRLNFAREQLRHNATLILAQSLAAKQALLSFGVPADKIRVSWPGTAGGRTIPRRTRRKGEPVAFGFIGNAGFAKGCHLLIEAFLKLNKGAASLTLYGGGESGYLRELREQSQGRVDFAGPYSSDELPEIMQRIDVGVVPSIWEECGPLVVSELLYHGVPVIGHDIGGIPEQLVSGEDGLLVAPGNVDALAAAMQRFIDEPDLLDRMPASCARVKTFSQWAGEVIALASSLTSGCAREAALQCRGEGAVLADRPGKAVATGVEDTSQAGQSPATARSDILSDLVLAETLERQGKLAACADKVQTILSSGAIDARTQRECHLLAGECLAKLGKAGAARKHLAAGLEKDPGNVELSLALASVELASGQVDKAEALFSEAYETGAAREKALCGLGLSRLRRGDYEGALNKLAGVLDLNPENLTALCGLTTAAYAKGRLSLLEGRLRKYLDYHPGDCDILYSLAGCLFAQGRAEEAHLELSKVLALRPDHKLARELKQEVEASWVKLERGASRGAAGISPPR